MHSEYWLIDDNTKKMKIKEDFPQTASYYFEGENGRLNWLIWSVLFLFYNASNVGMNWSSILKLPNSPIVT